MQQIQWFSRKFDFSNEQNIFPSLIERLWGTPIRIKEKLKIISAQHYTVRLDNSWSIAENIGHLADLETLWQGRMNDILHGERLMRTTDLGNRATHEANHNANSIKKIVKNFEKVREVTLNQIMQLKEEDIFKTALHPRLLEPMRIMDLFIFVAEHDDHHLARMTEINHILENS
jgi:uncharacterized damage-inducible protein DinB